MAKNVLVVDEAGNHYAPTYPRRAEGLIKHRRAYWVGPGILCIRRPPRKAEDYTMSNQTVLQDVLSRIDRILEDTSHLQSAFATIEKLPNQQGESESTKARAKAICELVRAREKTNRQTLLLLERIYANEAGVLPEEEPSEFDEELYEEILDEEV